MTYRAAGNYSLVKKALICLLSAVLVVGLMPAICISKAYAATTITSVEVQYDESAVVLNSSLTGNEANELFKANRSISADTQTKCKLDYMYSFLAEKVDVGSKGQILRKRLAGNDELLTPGKQYYLVYNLIQKEGYEFPSNSTDADLSVSVKVNGKTVSGVQVDRYNTDSVDVYVPIAFDSRPIVKELAIDPAEISMKQGSTRQLEAKIKGSQDVQLQWSLSGNKTSGTSIDSSGKVTIAASQPAGTVLTATATTVGVSPAVSATCKITVIDQNPSITSVTTDPGNAVVDVRDGARSLDFKVIMQGTADHDYDVELINAKAKGTEISNITREGFTLNVSGNEPSGAIRILLTSKVSAKTAFVTVTVTGIPRINSIDLSVDTNVLYDSGAGTQTGKSLNNYVNYNYISSNGSDTYVDFTRSTDKSLYTYIVKRTGPGWSYNDFTRVLDNDVLDTSREYYLRVNVDNYERSSNKSLWPKSLDEIAVTVNGEAIAKECVDWYSETETGSVAVHVPLGQKNGLGYSYAAQPYAPGVYRITLTGAKEPYKSFGMFNGIMQYKGETMYYDFDKRVWYYLVQGEPPVLSGINFASTNVQSGSAYLFYKYEINGTDLENYESYGEVNGNGRINIVDAQIIYDVACGNYKAISDLTTKRYSNDSYGLDGMKAMLYCDATKDGYVDASDARVTQFYALHGTWPKG